MIKLTKDDILKLWNDSYIEDNKEDIDYIIEIENFNLKELEDENLNKLSREEINGLMKYLIYLLINAFGGNYEDMYFYLSENEDGIYDKETVSFLLD